MNEITLSVNNGIATTTSIQIASVFGKRHDTVLRSIRNLECPIEFGRRNFVESSYINEQGKVQPSYNITRDGFSFLCMGFTGKKAAEWKVGFLDAFNAMESTLNKGIQAKPVPAPKQTRISSKTRTPEEMYYDALRVYTRGMKNVGALWIGMTELVFYRLDISDLKELTRESVQVAIQVVVDDLAGDRLGVEESLRYVRIPSAFN